MRELISLFRELIGKRKLVTELAKADFRKRFVGSYFGIVWMFIQPMVTIAIYAFIFGEHGMKNAPPVPGAYRGAEDQVRRFPPDHPFEDASRHGRFARRTAPRRP